MDEKILAARVGELLLARDEKVTTAESCTGGGVAQAITAISGSSSWFDMAIVSYSNDAKQRLLGVPPQLLLQHGAVSELVAVAMANGALKLADCHWALAISGIAGPNGGTEEKPVGTVCFALACMALPQALTCTQHFSGDRDSVRKQAVCYALSMLCSQLAL